MCGRNAWIWVSADPGGGQCAGGRGEGGWSSGLGWLGSAGPARVPGERGPSRWGWAPHEAGRNWGRRGLRAKPRAFLVWRDPRTGKMAVPFPSVGREGPLATEPEEDSTFAV